MQEQVEGFRLSPQQRALWNLRREAGYDTSLCAVLVEGTLVKARLQKALRQGVERHEILRTTFRHVAGIKLPVQVVGEGVAASWRESDLSGLSRTEQDAAVGRFIDEEAARDFDYERGPILRATLLTLASGEHVFVLSIFSLCADARTLSNVIEEVSAAYAAGAGDDDDEAGEPLQYAQVAEWQNELLESEEGEEGRGYWRRRGSPEGSSHRFSFERTPREAGQFKSGSYALKITPERVARIAAHVEARGASAEAFFLSCWQTLVWRHTGQPDPFVSVTLDGRRYAELEPAMGVFARTLPFGCHLAKGTRFESVLAQADESLRDAADWQEYFSPCAAEAAGKEGGVNSFPCIFEFTEQRSKLRAAGVSFSIFKRLAHAERFKLKLSCERAGGSVVAEFHYDPEMLGAQDVETLAGQFESLLENAVERAEASVDELELMGEAERRRLLVEWNETRAEYPDGACVQELFEAQAALTPSGVAVEGEGRRLTFAELNEGANRLAHYLRRLKVGAETQVGIVLPRSPEMVVALWAALKAGGAYVPVEPSYPRERIAFMLEGAGVVLTQKSLLGLLPEDVAARTVCLDESFQSIALESAENPAKAAMPSNLAYVIYTSGSTGQPKGVMVTHQSLVNYLSWCMKAYRADEGQGAPVHSPLAFGLVMGFMLLGGAAFQLAVSRGMRYQKRGRDITDTLFQHFRALTGGTKELKLHRRRRREAFISDVLRTTASSLRRYNFTAMLHFIAASSLGQVLFFVFIGTLLFIFPSIRQISAEVTTAFIITVLYMMNPLDSLMNTLSNLSRAGVSLRKVETLGLSLAPSPDEGDRLAPAEVEPRWQTIELAGVTHSYHREKENSSFILGPLDLTFTRGEVVFVIGGNGSGKTTFAKLLTGLYTPESGEIRVNGLPVTDETRDDYRQHFSVVFSDFYLFENLLGMEKPELDASAADYLAQLQLDHKVKVENGALSTTDLSQGQRKRLALLVAYLEDRPVYVFNESAADQDPLFKEVFYLQLLPMLKARGKTVVVISHDDRYFGAADRLVKLENGKLEYDCHSLYVQAPPAELIAG